MRFRRSRVRYAETPVPITPYQAAAQVWDERLGSAHVQTRNWRLMAMGCLSMALGMTGIVAWNIGQSQITPYVIEVEAAGQVRAVGEAITPYRPSDAQISNHLERFIRNVRSLPTDPIVVRQNWLEAYDYTTDHGAATLNEYARAHDPFAQIGQRSVSIEINSVVRASERSFQVRWSESLYTNGALSGTERWTALLTLAIKPPRTEERLRRNPLGIYVDAFNWSRELTQRNNP